MITKNSKLPARLRIVEDKSGRQTPNSKPTYHLSLITYHLLSKKAEGQIMIIAIVFLAVILILASALFGRVADFIRFGSNTIIKEQATHLAEAGIDYAIWQLNKTPGSCPSPSFCGSEHTLGTTGSFIVTVQDKTSSLKTITSTGYIPNSTTPRTKRTIKTDVLISNAIVAFNYGVQVGQGGFFIDGNSRINGNVYSNANIVGDGGSTIDGDAFAVGTITDVDWDLHVTGTKHPGSPMLPMPIADPATWYQQWKDAAVAGGTTSCPCTLGYQGGHIGPRKYQGNVTINGGGQYIVDGPIWVANGKLTISNGAGLWLAESFGSNETAIIVDGTISVAGGTAIHSTTAKPKGYILLASTSTSSSAISLTGGTQSSIFYVLDGSAVISGDTDLTAIVAKQLSMTGGSTLTYDEGLANSQFSGGPGGSWQIKKGTYRFTTSP